MPLPRSTTWLLAALGVGVGVVGLVWGVIREIPPTTDCGDPEVPESVTAAYAAPIVPVVLVLAALALAALLVALRAAADDTTAAGPVHAAVPVSAVAGFAVAAAFIAVGAGSVYLGTGILVGVPTGLLALRGLRAVAGRPWSWPVAVATVALGLLAIPVSVVAFLFAAYAEPAPAALAVAWIAAYVLLGGALAVWRGSRPATVAWFAASALCFLVPMTLTVVESRGASFPFC